MQRLAGWAKFQHVAKDGDAPALRPERCLAEHSQRRADRCRIGVVAFVDDQRRAAGQVDFDRRAAAGNRREFGQRQRRKREIGADKLGRCQHRERIDEPDAGPVRRSYRSVRCRGCCASTVEQRGCSEHLIEARVGSFMFAERDDARRRRLPWRGA